MTCNCGTHFYYKCGKRFESLVMQCVDCSGDPRESSDEDNDEDIDKDNNEGNDEGNNVDNDEEGGRSGDPQVG